MTQRHRAVRWGKKELTLATQASDLARQLMNIRQSLNIPHGAPSPSPSLPRPVAARPEPGTSSTSPTQQLPRLARPPDVPNIEEASEEDYCGDGIGDYCEDSPFARRKQGPSSGLPTPKSPPVLGVEGREKRRKPVRRQSGLLSNLIRDDIALSVPRAGSPVPCGSPIRREAVMALEREEQEGQDELEEEDVVVRLGRRR